jgi:hypothetical protein
METGLQLQGEVKKKEKMGLSYFNLIFLYGRLFFFWNKRSSENFDFNSNMQTVMTSIKYIYLKCIIIELE